MTDHTYEKASKKCLKYNAKLFEPKDQETNEKVFNISKEKVKEAKEAKKNLGYVFWWIGIQDSVEEGKFTYASNRNGSEIQWTNFAFCEPNNYQHDKKGRLI